MKKSIVTLGILTSFLAGSVTSCKDAETKVIDTQEEVLDARVDMMESKNEADEALENYRLEVYETISENNKKIHDLRVREIKGNTSDKENYKSRIDELEEKNEALKSKLDAYTSFDATNFETFKNEMEANTQALERELQELENQK